MEIKTILIPVDGSEPAENAFRYGVGLAEENGATIVLLHVLDANETGVRIFFWTILVVLTLSLSFLCILLDSCRPR